MSIHLVIFSAAVINCSIGHRFYLHRRGSEKAPKQSPLKKKKEFFLSCSLTGQTALVSLNVIWCSKLLRIFVIVLTAVIASCFMFCVCSKTSLTPEPRRPLDDSPKYQHVRQKTCSPVSWSSNVSLFVVGNRCTEFQSKSSNTS